MRIAASAFFTAVLLLARSAAAETLPPSTSDAPATPPTATEPIICVQGAPPTGSHFPGPKECHTRSEWEQVHTATGDAARRYLEGHDRTTSQIGQSQTGR